MAVSDSEMRLIDGLEPSPELNPADEQELGEMLAERSASAAAVYPVAGATQLALGNPPAVAGAALCLERLNRVVAHEPEDLLVTVQAGCPWDSMQEVLARAGQWIPVDALPGVRTTVGGLVATNGYGPSRLRFGRMRDFILGMRVVQADGTRTKAGGRVVKNVTGYDLCRLYAGSLGALGVFTEFHLRTLPLPEAQAFGVVSAERPEPLQLLGQRILDEGLEPVAQVLAPAGALRSREAAAGSAPGGFHLLIKFAGHPEAVAWQRSRVDEHARGLGLPECSGFPHAAADPMWRAALAFPRPDPGELLLKVIAPYGRSLDIVAETEAFAGRAGIRAEWLCYAGAHLLWLRLTGEETGKLPEVEAAQWLESLRQGLRADRGEVILAAGPAGIKRRFEVWGVVGKPLELMQGIKRQLDPRGILNPGRFVGRL